MTKSKKLALAVAVLGLLGSSAPSYAQSPEPEQSAADVTMDINGIGLNDDASVGMFVVPLPPPHIGVAGPSFMPPAEGDFLIAFPPPASAPELLALAPDGEEVIAEGPDGPGGTFISRRIEFRGGGNPFGGLNLTDEQLEKMFAIKKDSAGKSAAKMGELMSAHMNLVDLTTQPELDRSKILAAQARINALKADIANARLEDKLNMLSVLTTEQRRDLRKNMLERMGGGMCPMGMGRHHGGGMHRGPGGGGCPKKG